LNSKTPSPPASCAPPTARTTSTATSSCPCGSEPQAPPQSCQFIFAFRSPKCDNLEWCTSKPKRCDSAWLEGEITGGLLLERGRSEGPRNSAPDKRRDNLHGRRALRWMRKLASWVRLRMRGLQLSTLHPLHLRRWMLPGTHGPRQAPRLRRLS